MRDFFRIKKKNLVTDSYRPELDGIRAFAILLVLLGHVVTRYAWFGFLGVDIFFVLSGYVICCSFFMNIDFNYRFFIMRRFARIFPGVLAVLIVVSCIPSLRSYITWIDITKVLFLAKNFGNWDWPLGHLWSLSAEEQFYVFSGMVLATCRRRALKVRWIFLLSSYTLIILILGLVLTFSQHNFNSPSILNLVLLRPSEIAFGVLLAKRESHFACVFTKNMKASGQLSVLCFFFFSGFYFQSPTLISLFTIILIIMTKSINLILLTRILKNKILISIGILSYSIYIWHVPVIYLMPRFSNKSIHLSLTILAIMTIAYMSFIFIERPFRDFLNSRLVQ